MESNNPVLSDTFLNVNTTDHTSHNRPSSFSGDVTFQTLQQNLIMMGFDLTMINKVLIHFKIRQLNQAIDYLIKADDGLWNHPFVKSFPEHDDTTVGNSITNSILEIEPKNVLGNVLTRVKTIDSSTLMRQFSVTEICEICGEKKELHRIKNDIEENNNLIPENELHDDINVHNNDDEDNLINSNNDENISTQNSLSEKKNEKNENECGICMGEFVDPIYIENCNDKFCKECFNDYLVNLINNNNIDTIPCPNVNCDNKNLSEEFFSKYLNDDQYTKYNKFKEQNEIARDKQKMFCPLCPSFAKLEEGTNEQYDVNLPTYKKTTLICQNGHEFCSCGRPQHIGDCYRDGKEFDELLEKEKIKKCPRCGFLIKKNHGCNHMTCGNPLCRHQFCWLCLKEYTPDHFEVGACAGMQFNDPDSFSNRLKRDHPFLYCLYCLFKSIIFFVFIIVGVIALPMIGLWLISFMIVFFDEENARKTWVKFGSWFICCPILMGVQSVIYMIFGLIIAFIGIIIVLLILRLICKLFTGICKCVGECCCN